MFRHKQIIQPATGFQVLNFTCLCCGYKFANITQKGGAMKHFIIFLIAILFSFTTFADSHVRGYYRSNGTYVQPHYRSSANGTKSDNWSTRGNVNPYTGTVGTRNVYDSGSSYGSKSNSYYNSYGSGKSKTRSSLRGW